MQTVLFGFTSFDNIRDQESKKDEIEVFKILNGYEDIDENIFNSNLK